MPKLMKIPIGLIDPDSSQARKFFDPGQQKELQESIRCHGQQVPALVYEVLAADSGVKRYKLLDGERRWRAAQALNLPELLAMVYDQKPAAEEIRILQLTLDVHRSSLTAMERSNALAKLRAELNCSVSELAEHVSMKQPLVSKYLSLGKLDPSIQAMMQAGTFADLDKAHAISQEPDLAKQCELVGQATELSREALRRRVHSGPMVETKTRVAKFALPGGICVSLQGKDITLTLAIEVLTEAVKQLRHVQKQGISDVVTVQRMLRDTANASNRPRNSASS